MSLAIFDLDGTLIKGQSQQFLVFYLYKKKWLGTFRLVVILFWFLGYKIGICRDPNWIFDYAFECVKGKSLEDGDKMVESFFHDVLKRKFNDQTVSRLKKHQEKGDEVILVSNAIEPIVRIVANNLGIEKFFSTKLETKSGVYTGKIKGKAVYHQRKIDV